MAARDPHDPRSSDGLSESEAARRLADEGPNELASARPRSALRIALEVVREPMFLLLLACGALHLLLALVVANLAVKSAPARVVNGANASTAASVLPSK